MTTKFDTHVAAQGINASLHNALLDLGFKDDGLVGRYISVIDGVPVSSCPLIGIHMSKKANSRNQSLAYLDQTRQLLEKYEMIGYGHSEVTLARDNISSEDGLNLEAKPSFLPLHPSPSQTDKKWDVHITIPYQKLDERLKEVMQQYGFDWIDLNKTSKSTYRVYSAQGICSLDLGKRLYTGVVDWLKNMNVPSAKCKLEKYVNMYRIGNPEIVPPVIDKVIFVP